MLLYVTTGIIKKLIQNVHKKLTFQNVLEYFGKSFETC